MNLVIVQVDYTNPVHQHALLSLLEEYAKDPMGGGKSLSQQVKENLLETLENIPGAFSILAFSDSEPVGLINCFESLSTFQCKPLINIHDVIVTSNLRGQNIGQKMLEKVEQIAKERGCCKLTLEVLEGNQIAKKAYRKFGFTGYELDPAQGNALFLEKKLL